MRLLELPMVAEFDTKEDAEQQLRAVDEAVQATIAEHVPLTKPCPYSKRWWNVGLTERRKDLKRKAKAALAMRGIEGHPAHEAYRLARNTMAEEIRKAKAEHWTQWLEGLDDKTVWAANRLVMSSASDGGASRVPTLQIRDPGTKAVTAEAKDNDGKVKMFCDLFFPPRPEHDAVMV
jgi:hypothetical protein